MKLLLLHSLLGMLLCTSTFAQKKPNIIVIFADDISAREMPIYGSTKWSPAPQGGNTSDTKFRASTPVIDQLAKEGVYVKTAWATTICSPSRAMMMTGRYAHIHKWWHLKDRGTWINPNGKKVTWPLFKSSPKTIGHIAKEGGYATYWAGKTQMSGTDQFGFDEGVFTPGEVRDRKNLYPYSDFKIKPKKVDGKRVLVNVDTDQQVKYYAQDGWYWQPHVQLMNHPEASKKYEWWPNTKEAKKEYGLSTYGPDVEMEYIMEFMERKTKEDKPFFIYHTSHLGHDGWNFFSRDTNPKTREKWPGTPKIKWENGKYTRTKPHVTGDKGVYDTHNTVTEGGIHHHINYLDYQVWQYMNKLKELGEENNTILIFCADNGTSKYGKGSFVSQKGVHVPLVIYAPGFNFTKKGEQDILVNISDILPTVAEIAGVAIPKDYEINGKSLVPYLTTKTNEHREWIYSYHKDKQLIRGKNVLIDGHGKYFDVSKNPSDLISFPVITDWSKVSEAHRKEKEMLEKILPKYDNFDTEHDAPQL
ncbi:sulfatase-like hydrolase/transferase [Flammeovirga sp. EKP202]|uniref:sulfatase-like hydrolase/transferase n=1 Tax=Flammeovirga sp. EKP202 TaxID=2770592 RepID=UPI00165F496F|nr:sulfatase-like hydrolase/transferase [Flammeovirga sp. EKP202]MBD0403743.1 sulfatase-like hydrolase/transferase [Flammeovirga sp. EKP202]